MLSHYHYIEEVRLNKMPDEHSYISKLSAVKNLFRSGGLSFNSDVTMIIGENGSGKSTLLEAIAAATGFNPEGGSKNFNFGTYDSHSELSELITVSRGAYPKDSFFLRAESFYNAASYIEEIDKLPAAAPAVIDGYGGKSLHEQSHGESFLSVIKNRFFGNGLYILDEPEAALSPTGIMSLMVVIHELTGRNSQFIISTHSPILMTYPDALLYELTETEIRRTTYKETDHFIITKRFLNDPDKVLKNLFE